MNIICILVRFIPSLSLQLRSASTVDKYIDTPICYVRLVWNRMLPMLASEEKSAGDNIDRSQLAEKNSISVN